MEDSLRIAITCVVCTVVIAGLIGYVIDSYFDLTKSEKKEYSIMFDSSDITFQHDESGVTFVIDNINQVGNKPMSISDSTAGDTYSIFASEFSNGGEMIDLDARFDGQSVGKFQTLFGQSKQIDISVNKQFELGEYHGWFILPGPNSFSIPITLSTPPLIFQSMMIIIIGAITSIIVIELTKYANIQQTIKIKSTAELQIQQSQKLGFAGNAALAKAKEVQTKSELKVAAYHAQYSGPAAALKNGLLGFLPALFALVLALAAFINNEMVSTVVELNFQNVVALFLLGAGIESIKELFNRTNA